MAAAEELGGEEAVDDPVLVAAAALAADRAVELVCDLNVGRPKLVPMPAKRPLRCEGAACAEALLVGGPVDPCLACSAPPPDGPEGVDKDSVFRFMILAAGAERCE